MVAGVDIPTRYELRLSPPVLQISNAGGWESDSYLEKLMGSKVPSFRSNARQDLVRIFAKMILKSVPSDSLCMAPRKTQVVSNCSKKANNSSAFLKKTRLSPSLGSLQTASIQ